MFGLDELRDESKSLFSVSKRKYFLYGYLLFVDLVALLAAFLVGGLIAKIVHGNMDQFRTLLFFDRTHRINLLTFIMLAAIAVRQFHISGHYSRRLAFWDEIGNIVFVLSAALALNAAVAFAGKWQLSRIWMFSAWFSAIALVVAFRIAALALAVRAHLLNGPTAIIGCGANASEAIKALVAEPFLGCQPKWLVVPPGAVVETALFPPTMQILSLGEHPLDALADLGNPLL